MTSATRPANSTVSTSWFHSSSSLDNATEERTNWLVEWSTKHGQPSASNAAVPSSSSVSVFASTSLKPGMHADMASTNTGSNGCSASASTSAVANSRPQQASQPPPPPPPEPSPPKPARHIQWAGAESRKRKALAGARPPPPPLPTVDELERQLVADDALFRRCSAEQLYWGDDGQRDGWQRELVARLVRAKHERLDATQHPLLRCARRLARAEAVELWWRMREMRAASQKRRREGK
ncbi:hypothetical protein F4818DRAFT_92758 [Hypoxylon cercidicola]|nr:hypothetical protein F4818DRAFT_92758 [Hypoxylon cercidicola]